MMQCDGQLLVPGQKFKLNRVKFTQDGSITVRFIDTPFSAQIGEVKSISVNTYPVCSTPLTTHQITVSGTLGVCPGTEYIYTANASTVIQCSEYSWTWPGNWFLVSQFSNKIKLRTPQSSPDGGTVRVSINNGCGWSGFTGITVFPGCFFFSTFPNPSSEELTIAVNQKADKDLDNPLLKEEFMAELYNDSGVKVRSVATRQKEVKMNTANLKEGIYSLKIFYQGTIEEHKVIID